MLTIVRYGEIALKGQNRIIFENQLVGNIRVQTGANVIRRWNRIYVDIDRDKLSLLKNVFGIVSYSPCIEAELSYESIQDAIMKLGLDGYDHINKFRITCQRLEKNLDTSIEIEKKLGGFVIDNFGWKVSLKDYDVNISVEISNKAYIFTEKVEGVGGLPVGCSGNVGVKLDNDKSLLCAFLLMKRGCDIIPTEGSNDKLIQKIQRFAPYNLKDAFGREYIAVSSSRTMDDFNESDNAVGKNTTLTLTPIIGMDEGEIKQRVMAIIK